MKLDITRLRYLDVKGLQHPFEQVVKPGVDVIDKTDSDLVLQLANQVLNECRLAGTNLAANHGRACPVQNAGTKFCQRPAMLAADVEKRRVGKQGKRFFPELVK